MATRTAFTLEQLAGLPEDGMLHELDEGELIAKTKPARNHGRCQARIAYFLNGFVLPNRAGEVQTESGFVLGRDPEILRGPDVAFVRAERLIGIPDDGWPELAPDLVVEVVSPSETASQINRKVRQFLAAGSQSVWVVYPDTRSVDVFESTGQHRVMKIGGTLTTPALPGFELTVAAIFED